MFCNNIFSEWSSFNQTEISNDIGDDVTADDYSHSDGNLYMFYNVSNLSFYQSGFKKFVSLLIVSYSSLMGEINEFILFFNA